MHLQSGTLLEGGKYRIISTLGRGGFGITYLAEQVNLRRRVCIKEFFPKDYYKRNDDDSLTVSSDGFAEMMDKFKAKFVKEAQTIAALDHPNIIPIHDVFEENGTAYYVMDYIEGESLSELVKSNGAMSERDAVAYIKQIAAALEHIHDRKINHLDVKPGNIMVREEDNRAILIDFGLSKHYDASSGEATSTTPVGVSHGYAPMEQYKQGGVSKFSPETDIYSLGATLYYLVTGSVPPQAADIGKDGIGELPSELSSNVCVAIRKSMSYWKDDRPHTIKEFLALLDNKVVKPKPKKRRWWLWCLLLLFIVVLCISLKDLFRGSDNAKEVAKEEKRVEMPAEEVVTTPIESEQFVLNEPEEVEELVPVDTPVVEAVSTEAEAPAAEAEDLVAEVEEPVLMLTEVEALAAEVEEPVLMLTEVEAQAGEASEISTTYKIGDYYNENGKQGVVFEVTDDGRHGKIVSLDDTMAQWCTDEQYAREIALGLTDKSDGKANTDKVMQRDDSDQYPAFVWCRNKGADWYLPAINELEVIYNNKSAIKSTLAKYNAKQIVGFYWSSTDYENFKPEFCAWIVNMDHGTHYNHKYHRSGVRAVSAF